MAREQAEHFWPLKPKAQATTPSTAASRSAVGVDDDGVLAAHLEDGALDADLAGLGLGGALVDLEADLLGAGEGDEAGLGVGDDGGAEAGAFAGAEVDDAVGQAGLFEQVEEAAAMVGASTEGLRMTVLPRDDGGGGHAGHDGEREVPRRDDGADAERECNAAGCVLRGTGWAWSAASRRRASRA